jgi:hypothetical protein
MIHPVTEQILLPTFSTKKVFRIPSDEVPKQKYAISINLMSCERPAFTSEHSKWPTNDFRRTCKHIRQAIVQSEIMPDSWLRKLLGDRFTYERYFVPEGLDCAFGYSLRVPWIRYFGRSHTTYKGTVVHYGRFSYSVVEKRWASGKQPMEAEKVVQYIEQHFPVTSDQCAWKPSWPPGTTKQLIIEI